MFFLALLGRSNPLPTPLACLVVTADSLSFSEAPTAAEASDGRDRRAEERKGRRRGRRGGCEEPPCILLTTK
jgi:hypothetical protein